MSETATVTVPVATAAAPAKVGKVNKSQLIMAALHSQGVDTPARDIIDFIQKESGVEVQVSLVNVIRSKVRDGSPGRKRRKRRTPEVNPSTPVGEIDQLLELKKFANAFGGVGALKTLVDKLEQLITA